MKRLIILFVLLIGQLQYLQAQCTEDCVWPGDMNANGIANNLDVLALGLAWGASGPARTNMSTDWEALEAEDWAGNLPVLGSNFKHCDANGDGMLEEDDLIVINLNYNKTNPDFTGLLGNKIAGTDLFVVPQNTVVTPGGSLIFDIHLGAADNVISGIHGIGFQLDMDTQYVAEVLFDFSDNWMGQPDELLEYGKYSEEFDHAGLAFTRFDGNEVEGFGKIARVEIVIVDVILAFEKDSMACLPFTIDFKNVLGLSAEEEDLMISSRADSANIKHRSQLTSTQAPASDFELNLYPNPVKEQLYIQYSAVPITTLIWYNQLGQQVYQEQLAPSTNGQLQVPDLPSGIYFLALYSKDHRRVVKKIHLE